MRKKKIEKGKEYDNILEIMVTGFVACVILFIFVKIVFL